MVEYSYQLESVKALKRQLIRVKVRLTMIKGRKVKDGGYQQALALANTERREVVLALLMESRILRRMVCVTRTEVSSMHYVRQRVRTKGFGLSLGDIKERNRKPDVVLGSPDECWGQVGEPTGDGGCNWGRSWAAKTGKHSLRNAINQGEAREERRVMLARPTYQRTLVEREKNRLVSDLAVHDLFLKADRERAELESWNNSDDLTENDTSYVIKRFLMWK